MLTWLIASMMIFFGQSATSAPEPITILTDRPTPPELGLLKRYLRLQGYEPTSKPRPAGLSLHLTSAGPTVGAAVSFQRGTFRKRFELPSTLRTTRVRARMITMYLELFLEAWRAKRAQGAQTKQPVAPKARRPAQEHSHRRLRTKAHRQQNAPRRRAVPKPHARKTRTLRNLRRASHPSRPRHRSRPTLTPPGATRRRHTKANDRARAPMASREAPDKAMNRRSNPDRDSLPPNEPQKSPGAITRQPPTKLSQPKVPTPGRRSEYKRKGPPQVRKQPSHGLLAPRSQAHKARPRRTKEPPKLALQPTASLRHSVPKATRGTRIWGSILSLDVGLGGGFRAALDGQLQGGGSIYAGLNAWRWTLRLELALHTYYLEYQARNILFLRPSFWLGGWLPLGQAERWLKLSLLAGLCSELFLRELPGIYDTSLYWGIGVSAQLHWQWSKRWSMYLRASGIFFPGGIVDSKDTARLFYPPLQVVGQMGFQVRL